MRHTNHDFLNAAGTSLLDDVVDHRNQTFAAFQRKSLLADVARVKVSLDALCRGQLFENLHALFVAERVGCRTQLKALAEP